eukprot:11697018-Alexandrium_andersonii.AAC.1
MSAGRQPHWPKCGTGGGRVPSTASSNPWSRDDSCAGSATPLCPSAVAKKKEPALQPRCASASGYLA